MLSQSKDDANDTLVTGADGMCDQSSALPAAMPQPLSLQCDSYLFNGPNSASDIQALICNISDKDLLRTFIPPSISANVDFGGKALKCTACDTRNVKYSVAERLLAQGAPIRCNNCRSTCWACGNQHVCGHMCATNYDMCDGCRLGIIIDRAESTETELSLDLARAIVREIDVHGHRAYLYSRDSMLWPGGGQAVKLVELLLKKCKDGPSRIECHVGVHPKLATMLKERGVSEDAILSMRSKCNAQCRALDARFGA